MKNIQETIWNNPATRWKIIKLPLAGREEMAESAIPRKSKFKQDSNNSIGKKQANRK